MLNRKLVSSLNLLKTVRLTIVSKNGNKKLNPKAKQDCGILCHEPVEFNSNEKRQNVLESSRTFPPAVFQLLFLL